MPLFASALFALSEITAGAIRAPATRGFDLSGSFDVLHDYSSGQSVAMNEP